MIKEQAEQRPVPTVTIVILNWNSWQETIGCLESLRAITWPHWRAIVVDNGSTNDSIAQIESWIQQHPLPLTVLRTERNLGFTGGNNFAIRHAFREEFDFLLFLNNDTTVDPGFLEPLVEFATTHPHVGMVGPVIYEAARPQTIQSAGARIQWRNGKFPPLKDGFVENKPRQVDYIGGAAMLVSREIIEKIGILDEAFFLYVEEVDWCYRAAQAGCGVWVVPQSRIWHKSAISADTMRKPLLEYYRFRNRIFFMRKHACWYHWLFFVPYLLRHFAGKIIGYTVNGQKDLRAAFWRAVCDGFGLKLTPQSEQL